MRKTIIAALLLPLIAFAQPQQPRSVVYDVVLTRVIDGDTVAFEAKWLPDPLKKELSIRVDRKSTRLNSSHSQQSRMPSSA